MEKQDWKTRERIRRLYREAKSAMGRGDLYEDKPWKYQLRDFAALVSICATLGGGVFFVGGYMVLQYRVGEVESLSRMVANKFDRHCLDSADIVGRLEERVNRCCGGK